MKKIIPIWSNGELDENSPNKVFCMAPFSHTYLSPQGERRLCCASREQHSFQKQYIDSSNDTRYGKVTESKTSADDFNPIALKDHWNSEYMREIRRKLMSGEKISQCDVCNEDILSLNSYRKWFTGYLFHDKIQEAFDKTDETGYTKMEPISFDYRFSNLCNFKCRMCGEMLSSSWESEKRINNLWSPKNQAFMIHDVKDKMSKFQTTVAEPEFKDAVTRGIVEECYWVGGEPLMYDIHWWALDEMTKNGSAQNCYLRYNTNLSRINYKGANLFDYLPKFKNWMICASIDGTGDIVEYIRTGINWEKWLENFKEGLKLPFGNDRMILDLTITGPGMFSLKELFDLSLQLDVRIETKLMFAFHADIMFTPMAWPRNILNKIIDDHLSYMEPKATWKQKSLINTLKNMRERKTHQEQWPDTYIDQAKKGKEWIKTIDNIRKDNTIENIYSKDAELIRWWNSI